MAMAIRVMPRPARRYWFTASAELIGRVDGPDHPDLSAAAQAQVGDEVVLWGDGPVEEVAACAGTISYELTCRLTPRCITSKPSEVCGSLRAACSPLRGIGGGGAYSDRPMPSHENPVPSDPNPRPAGARRGGVP